MHREDLSVDLRSGESAFGRRKLSPDKHGEHAPDPKENGCRNDEALAQIGVADAGENAAPARLAFPDARQIAVELDCFHGAASSASGLSPMSYAWTTKR